MPASPAPEGSATVRVCMLIWHFHPLVGGAERQCLRLSRDLARRLPVHVVTQRIPGSPGEEVFEGIRIHRVPSLSRFRALAQAVFARLGVEGRPQGWRWPLAKLRERLVERLPRYAFIAGAYWTLYRLRREFDILHVHEAHWIASLGARFARRHGKPILIKEASSGEYLRLNFATQWWAAETRRNAVFIAISTRIAGELRALGIAEGRIRVVPNGVDLPPQAWDAEQARKGAVLFVGNLSQQPYKGIDVLLRAWGPVAASLPEAHLTLLGGGDGMALRALARELGIESRVSFLGAVKDVDRRMLASALFVLPSRLEGMSNSLLEAMALGMPVISTRISGSEDLIRPGENGLLVPAEDPRPLGEAIQALLGDPAVAASMGREARRTIEAGYTIEAVSRRYEELYHSLLEPPQGPGRP